MSLVLHDDQGKYLDLEIHQGGVGVPSSSNDWWTGGSTSASDGSRRPHQRRPPSCSAGRARVLVAAGHAFAARSDVSTTLATLATLATAASRTETPALVDGDER